jgi:hypothetical protein
LKHIDSDISVILSAEIQKIKENNPKTAQINRKKTNPGSSKPTALNSRFGLRPGPPLTRKARFSKFNLLKILVENT